MKKRMATLTAAMMLLALTACGGQTKAVESAPAESAPSVSAAQSTAPTEKPETVDSAAPAPEGQSADTPAETPAAEAPAAEAPAAEAPAAEAPAAESSAELVDGMRPEFKEAMDSYEAFYDQYCTFMEKYNANPTDLTLLAEYGSMLVKMDELNKKFDAWESEDMNNTETKYYIEVNSRITQKLLDVAQ